MLIEKQEWFHRSLRVGVRDRNGATTRALLSLVLVLGLSACGSTQPASSTLNGSLTAAEYRLAPGDQLRITVLNQLGLSGEFTVDEVGFIALPFPGPVEAKGKTPRELEEFIATELTRSGYLVDPNVAVEVSRYRPYYILGEVGTPGAYPYTTGLTVRNAVATAGGFTYRANMRRVYIQRAGESEERLYDLTPATTVMPGDTIRIAERFF